MKQLLFLLGFTEPQILPIVYQYFVLYKRTLVVNINIVISAFLLVISTSKLSNKNKAQHICKKNKNKRGSQSTVLYRLMYYIQ